MGTGGRHSHGGPSAAAAAAAAAVTRPGLPLRRYSVPEVVMRKASLRQRAAAAAAAWSEASKQPTKKEDDTKNISVISERSVVKCETTSQCFSMTLSSECKVSVGSDVPKVAEPCSKTLQKKRTQFSKEDDPSAYRLDTVTERSYCTTVENSDTAAKEMTDEDHEVQHIMSDKRSSTPVWCRRHRRSSASPCSVQRCAISPCKDVSPEITDSPLGKNRPDSASSSVTLDQSVSERSSSTQDSTETNSPCEMRRRTATPYKKGVIRDLCGNKVHVLSETSSFIVFETPSPSPTPSPTCHPYPNEPCCCVCTCCKKRDCNARTKRATQDKTASVNTRDRRSTNVKSQTEQSSATVEATVNRESAPKNDDAPDLSRVDSNGNVTSQKEPKCQFVETRRDGGDATEKEKDNYLVKTETIEKWENNKGEWTEKKVSHVVQHQPGPIRDAKTYTLSNRINIANNNPTLVASEIVEIPPSERHAFCLMCQEEKREVTLPSIKTSNEAQNMKNEAEFWNKLVGQSTRAQTNIPQIEETQAKETENLYPWSKVPEKNESQAESSVTTTEATVVPRYSAVPRTVSMLVNTSSAEASSDSDLSCADSLESVHIPRKSIKHDSKPVRGHVLLAESTTTKDTKRRVQPPKVYFIRLSEDDGVVEDDLTPVSECMPEKLKEKLVERHTSVRHTEHCRHHEEERHQHNRSVRDIPNEETKSPQHRSMASQAVIKECSTKSTSTQRIRSKREVPAIVRVHKCHLEEDYVRPMFKAKPYKGATLKSKPSKQPPPPPAEPKPKSRSTQPSSMHSSQSVKSVHQKQDQSSHIGETTKAAKIQSETQTTPTPCNRQQVQEGKAMQKVHSFNHAMQTQTTPPRSVETLTVDLEDDGKRVAKSSQTEVNKNRPTSRPTPPTEKVRTRREVPASPIPAVKFDSTKTPATKTVPRQRKPTTTEMPRKKEAPKTDESPSETENILGETDEILGCEGSKADRKLESSSSLSAQRLTTPRRSGSIARFRHKFPVIPEEQREVSPSSPKRGVPQRRSPAVITSLNAMSQTEPEPVEKLDEPTNSCSNTDGSLSDNDRQDSQPIQYTVKMCSTSPDFNSQSQQTDALPQPKPHPQPHFPGSQQPVLTKTSGGTQTDHSNVDLTKQSVPSRRSVWVDASTGTEARKSDASTSTATPRSSLSSATSIQKEMTKTSTTIQKEITKSTSIHSTDTVVQKETTKSISTQSSPPETAKTNPVEKQNSIPAKSMQTAPLKPSAVTKLITTPKPSTTPKRASTQSIAAAAAVAKQAEPLSSAMAKTKLAAPKPAADRVKASHSASTAERTRGSWASRKTSVDSNQAYSRRKAAAIEHVNRLERLLHHEPGPATSLSACDDISCGGSCESDSTHYLSPAGIPAGMSTSPIWGGRDGRVSTSASLAGRRHIRSRPTRRDPTGSTLSTDRLLYRHHEPPRLSAPGPPPSDGAGWTVTVAGGSNVGSVIGGVSSSVDPNHGAQELEMRVMIAEASSVPTNRSAGSSRWSLTIRNQPASEPAHQQVLPDSTPSRNCRPPSLPWPRFKSVQHFINGSASPRESDSASHHLSVTGSAIKRKYTRHLD